jgi:hypothetical protein
VPEITEDDAYDDGAFGFSLLVGFFDGTCFILKLRLEGALLLAFRAISIAGDGCRGGDFAKARAASLSSSVLSPSSVVVESWSLGMGP